MDSKYGSSWGEWYSNEPMGVGLWKNIRRGSMFDYDMICGMGI